MQLFRKREEEIRTTAGIGETVREATESTAHPDPAATLQEELQKSARRMQRQAAIGLGGIFLSVIMMMVDPTVQMWNISGPSADLWWGFDLGMAGYLMSCAAILIHPTPRSLVAALEHSRGAQCCRVLLQATQGVDVRKSPKAHLTRMLSELTPSEARSLDSQTLGTLRRLAPPNALRWFVSGELRCAALRVLDRARDGGALPYVRQAAEGRSPAEFQALARSLLPNFETYAAESALSSPPDGLDLVSTDAGVVAAVTASMSADELSADLRRLFVARRRWTTAKWTAWGVVEAVKWGLIHHTRSLLHHHPVNLPAVETGNGVIGILNVVSVLLLGLAFINWRASRRVREAVGTCRESAALGAIMATEPGMDVEFARLRRDALLRLLPRMTEEDSGALDEADLRRLRRLVSLFKRRQIGVDPPLRIAALRALDRVHDSGALPLVRPLTRPGVDPELRELAERLLPNFEAYSAAAQHAGTLVRPAEAPASGELLRPSSGRAVSGDDLLRATAAPPATDDAP